MRRKHLTAETDRIEIAIGDASSIGALERLAGIGPAQDERAAFSKSFMTLAAARSLDAGVAELKRHIRLQSGARACKTPIQ